MGPHDVSREIPPSAHENGGVIPNGRNAPPFVEIRPHRHKPGRKHSEIHFFRAGSKKTRSGADASHIRVEVHSGNGVPDTGLTFTHQLTDAQIDLLNNTPDEKGVKIPIDGLSQLTLPGTYGLKVHSSIWVVETREGKKVDEGWSEPEPLIVDLVL